MEWEKVMTSWERLEEAKEIMFVARSRTCTERRIKLVFHVKTTALAVGDSI